ncbi:12541_t:CDS:2, partial [Gigaspora margarita]
MDVELFNVEEYQFDLVNPKYKPEELFENKLLSKESINNNSDEEVPEITNFSCKSLHPYGQGILGVLHAAKINNSEIKNYIHQIEWFDSDYILITCMLKEQAELLINLKSFQIDISYKHIK